MKTIAFFVAGDPKGQPRPRAFAFHGKARVYDPGTAEGWKSRIALEAKRFLKDACPDAASNLSLCFHFQRPKGHHKKDGSINPKAPMHHLQKPDLDNLAKAVMDAMTTLGFWNDDSQVKRLECQKQWAEPNHESGVEIIVDYD